jgi:predicted nucleic acid-binding protein
LNFLDSNVLLYVVDETEPRKQGIAVEILAAARGRGDVISFQVVQECLNVLLRSQTAASLEEARRFLRIALVPLWKVQPTAALYERTLDVRARYQYSFYDGLIIAAALEAGCDQLLSEDLQAGQRIEGLTIVNPLV